MKGKEIVFRNRQITANDIEAIKQLIHAHWEEGRTSLSRHLCQQWNWRQPNGQLKD